MSDDEFVASEWERFQHARIDLLQKRQIGWERTDEEICGVHDLTVNRYWEILLKDDQKASDLEQILIEEFLSSRGFVTPDRRPYSIFKLCVRGALNDALESGKAWIRRPNVAPEVVSNTRKQTNIERIFPDIDLARIKIDDAIEGEKRDPNDLVIVSMRDAIRWLMKNPEYSDLVSADLRAIIQSVAASPVPVPLSTTPEAEQAPTPPKAVTRVDIEARKRVPKRQKGGQKGALNQERVDSEVFRLMDHHGDFSVDDPVWNAQARLEEAISDFSEKEIGRRLTEGPIRKYVQRSLKRWRKQHRRRRIAT
jgi:hypothetical protein